MAFDLIAVMQALVVGAFGLLASVALARCRRQGPAARWAAGAFGALAVAVALLWGPGWFVDERPGWATDVALVTVVWFPYLLLRFTATFRPLPRPMEVAAVVAALAASVVVLLPDVPDGLVLGMTLPYWTGVSLVTVVRLWRAGRGQPGVARRRMRLMASAVAVLNAALLIAVQTGDVPLAELATHTCLLASALGFGLGFSPPRPLRMSWRRNEDAALQAATAALLQADDESEIARRLLPPAAAVIGAHGAALVDADGRVAASHGRAPAVGRHVDEPDHRRGAATVRRRVGDLGDRHGQLTVWASPYTPFFGHEEQALLESMAAIARLALDRTTLLADERARHRALEEARRQAEEARQQADRANQAKSEFLSRMSHEFRTPLNAILGFGQLLELSSRAREDEEAVAHVLKAGRHLLALIDDVLDLSRIEAGTLSISLEPVHAGELVADSVALVESMAQPRGIRITTDTQGCDAFVLTDRQRCRQVLLNLLSNAIKYNRDHGAVEVGCHTYGDAAVRISVQDTGPGIEAARTEQLFQPFERLGAELTSVQGTGLGLALSRQMIERLGGAIGVETTPGLGSTFWIELPLTEPPEAPTPPVIQTDVSAPADDRQILLVEDNLANLRLVEMLLRRRPGLSVLPAMQGALALDLAYQQQPDVVVLDLHLPDMPGRAVLHRLKADPRTRHIPVVIASADASASRMRRLREEGAFDYVTKPLDVATFLTVLDRALGLQDDEPE